MKNIRQTLAVLSNPGVLDDLSFLLHHEVLSSVEICKEDDDVYFVLELATGREDSYVYAELSSALHAMRAVADTAAVNLQEMQAQQYEKRLVEELAHVLKKYGSYSHVFAVSALNSILIPHLGSKSKAQSFFQEWEERGVISWTRLQNPESDDEEHTVAAFTVNHDHPMCQDARVYLDITNS
jgi:hypothetical protein